ncbi:hypothetical protein AAE478_001057 [Parahypoxylon ruwenzoriense]
MPQLSNIHYSRDVCVTAVRDYYRFLTKMYLKKSDVIEPPPGGWPTITSDCVKDLGKTDKVGALLRHLPYIRAPSDDRDKAHGAPWCYFADWQSHCRSVSLGRTNGEDMRLVSQSASLYEKVPPHVIGLTSGGRDNPVFLLDTELGIVHWHECPGEIRYNPSREPVEDDPYDYAPDNEADWRADAPAWAVPDFFEVLKDQFRALHFIPISSRSVLDVYAILGRSTNGMIPMLQDIYRQHGWPEIERYHKRECLEAVQSALEERYPNSADRREDM